MQVSTPKIIPAPPPPVVCGCEDTRHACGPERGSSVEDKEPHAESIKKKTKNKLSPSVGGEMSITNALVSWRLLLATNAKPV